MAGLDWLIARPVAHRGLHDAQKGVIENTPSAFAAVIAGGYGIECDLQVSADGEAMVHHDDVLGRLTVARAAGAGVLSGAAESARARTQGLPPPVEGRLREQTLALIASALGAEQSAALAREGSALSLADAVTLADAVARGTSVER